MAEDTAAAWADLPTPERLPVRTMLEEFETVNVLAPLVRCSKLPFRHLVSLYETHITHTPMILAEEFSRSQQARVSDLSTSSDERGVFWMEPRRHPPRVEPGALGALEALRISDERDADGPRPPLADAAELIAPHIDGLDINCGCPQRWAYAEGIGCALLRKPELVADMVRCVHDRMGWEWPVSIKIRVDPDLRRTEQLVRTALAAGVSHITVHGRTRHQASTDPVSLDKLAFAVECVRGEVPTVANGDLWDLEDAHKMRRECGVHGVMAARGLLANPALFAGYDRTPVHAVENFVNLGLDYGFIFSLFHRHLAYMLESHFVKPEKTYFNALSSSVQVVEYLQTRGLDFGARRKVPMWDARRGYSLL
ncbi:hypothetical protein CcaverHIS002_0105180 [Cutaneotrichosporon cavernicola]|nr:hypothetical protein CcaverHIS002_0105180 [Cutaneotrichosporon cavernicola]